MKIHELPLSPCHDCFENEIKTDEPTGMAVVYCEHNQVGAYFKEKLNRWTTINPIEREDFADYFEQRRLLTDLVADELRPDADARRH